MVRARILSAYPADPYFTGWPAEVTDVVLDLSGFAANAGDAHARILRLIQAGRYFDLPCEPGAEPLTFTPELIRCVLVWQTDSVD